jgi:hypothetical protein
MTVHTAIEHLVWAHKAGQEEARRVAMAYVVQHYKAIQVIPPLVSPNVSSLLCCVMPQCSSTSC